MRVLAVPVKPLERSKRRLSPVLSPAERAALTLVMLQDVLDAALGQPGWEVWVVSPSEAVLEVTARRGGRPLAEEGGSLLAAIRQVEAEMRGRWSRLAVLLADVPFITPATLGDALGRRSAVVATPADSDGGTNLLMRRPPSIIRPRFGRSSFAKHRAEAYRGGVTFEEARIPELGFDVDRPADLAAVVASGHQGRTRAACLEMGLPERLTLGA